jgi:Transposase DDE domain
VATRRNKDGTPVRYLQLTHNEWDPATKTSRPKVLHSFGREDQLDRGAIKRLVASLTRLLDPAIALRTSTGAGPAELAFTSSRPVGGTLVLDALWRRLGIDTVMTRLLTGRKRDPRTERVLFALVANRALGPGSKLAAAGWVNRRAHIDGLAETSDDACYRAMDWLLDIAGDLEREVFWQVATLLDHEVDLLFFDTTSTYFETDEPDPPVVRDTRGRPVPDPLPATTEDSAATTGSTETAAKGTAAGGVGFRTYGKSKDSRDDLPQVVIGMAVTRAGIPVRVWCWPGNTTDSALIRQAREDMRDWTLARVMWVADRGFSSAANRRELRRGGGHYIIGERLRSGSAEATTALSRQGRYSRVRDNLQVKEVSIATDERFVICYNPEQADRDAALREVMTGKLTALIADTDRLSVTKRAELRGRISTMPGLNRFLRTTPGGLLRLDKTKIAAEANLDGKYLLRCSDPHLSAEDIALGYKQLLQVERGWRDMKTTLQLRPVYHRLEDRIRAHVILCWLALLLVRIVETTTGDTWNRIREDLQELHVGTFEGPAGTFRQRTELTTAQRDILAKLGVDAPKKIIELGPPATS